MLIGVTSHSLKSCRDINARLPSQCKNKYCPKSCSAHQYIEENTERHAPKGPVHLKFDLLCSPFAHTCSSPQSEQSAVSCRGRRHQRQLFRKMLALVPKSLYPTVTTNMQGCSKVCFCINAHATVYQLQVKQTHV